MKLLKQTKEKCEKTARKKFSKVHSKVAKSPITSGFARTNK
jgi:hypothetical protein